MAPPDARPPNRRTRGPQVRVWDLFVRCFHWGLVASMATAWLWTERINWVHRGAGTLAVALVCARIVWGFAGTRHARFAKFVPGYAKLRRYVPAWVRGREPRHLGHNPLGALMVLYLMAAVLVIGISGWMMGLDAFWGNEVVETVHTTTVDITLWAVVLHVLANLLAGWRHRENLVLAMWTGRKAAPKPRAPKRSAKRSSAGLTDSHGPAEPPPTARMAR